MGEKIWTDGFLLSGDGKELFGCSLSEKVVRVPETVQTIQSKAFSCSDVQQVILPHGLLDIGVSAFAGCRALKTISLPDGLQRIWHNAFADSGITELMIPESVGRIANTFLRGCRVRKLVLLGHPAIMDQIFDIELPEDAELMADTWDIQQYPPPYGPVHGLRNFAKRRLAGELVPPDTAVRFRTYLKRRYREHWSEPLLLQLILEMRVIPAEEIDRALADALQGGDPAVTAALLTYQQEVLSPKVLERVRRERRG